FPTSPPPASQRTPRYHPNLIFIGVWKILSTSPERMLRVMNILREDRVRQQGRRARIALITSLAVIAVGALVSVVRVSAQAKSSLYFPLVNNPNGALRYDLIADARSSYVWNLIHSTFAAEDVVLSREATNINIAVNQDGALRTLADI